MQPRMAKIALNHDNLHPSEQCLLGVPWVVEQIESRGVVAFQACIARVLGFVDMHDLRRSRGRCPVRGQERRE